jgi:hypothetical protein
MNVSVYCGKWLIPAKNGTRYMDKIFPVEGKKQGDLQHIIDNTNKGKRFKKKCVVSSQSLYSLHKTKITHLFLRDPYSHLYSAIHTDLWGHISTEDKKIGLSPDNVNLLNSIHSYIGDGTGHWCCDLYESLFWLLKKKGNIIVLPLSELTPFIESLGYKEKYNPNDYNFKELTPDEINLIDNISRKDVIDWLKLYYPYLWNNIMKLLQKDIPYYNRILKGEFGPELPKVKNLSIDYSKKFL